MEGPQDARQARTPDPHAQAALATAIAEAVRDRDERVLRRLLARFAEQAAITDLPALRDALDTTATACRRPDRPAPARATAGSEGTGGGITGQAQVPGPARRIPPLPWPLWAPPVDPPWPRCPCRTR